MPGFFLAMDKALPPVIAAEDLALLNKSDYVLIDAGPSRERYMERHLKRAAFADLNTDLADVPEDAAHGGRHPLPAREHFGKVLGKLGISAESHVIVYDDKNGANPAARLWWMLRAAGHDKVQVLSGGMQAAEKAGFPVTDAIDTPPPLQPYNFTHWHLPTADITEVETAASDGNRLVIDVRDKERFDGITEPIDLIAGHIPGAINIPFSTNLDANGNFLSTDVLKENYTKALGTITTENVIVHCGSGVTACHTLLAMDHAGLGIPKLYTGSWSEWSRNVKPVGKNII